jgi:hypothetical protein
LSAGYVDFPFLYSFAGEFYPFCPENSTTGIIVYSASKQTIINGFQNRWLVVL